MSEFKGLRISDLNTARDAAEDVVTHYNSRRDMARFLLECADPNENTRHVDGLKGVVTEWETQVEALRNQFWTIPRMLLRLIERGNATIDTRVTLPWDGPSTQTFPTAHEATQALVDNLLNRMSFVDPSDALQPPPM